MKEIKVEWCENFIKATFGKLPSGITGIYTGCFWKMAEKAGLYEPGTFGSPMSEALGKLTEVEAVHDAEGNFIYHCFRMKSE